MPKGILTKSLFILFLTFLGYQNSAIALPAFPGAEGFGSDTPGGRGGKVFRVTNLNDSGSGSLRECVEASGARTCVFTTGGTINLQSQLLIDDPYITIAGQTAPGGGITLKRKSGGDVFYVQTHDVIIRYLTIRVGVGGTSHAILIGKHAKNNVYDIIVDHCSLSWATDEVLTTWYGSHDISIQWSIVSEGLDCSTHPKGCHSKGALLGGPSLNNDLTGKGAEKISFHHNLVAHIGERAPMIKSSGVVDVVNNVLYNPYWQFSYIDMASQYAVSVNYIGNYFKQGPDSGMGQYEIGTKDNGGANCKIYVQGNIGPHRKSDSNSESYVVDPRSRSYVVGSRHSAPQVATSSATAAYSQVLNRTGNDQGLSCDGKTFFRRDTVDQRVINDVQTGEGRVIDDPSDVGGWPNIAKGSACMDKDKDGMPDAWENLKGFDSNDASDNVQDYDNDGYTNIEEYMNGTNPGTPSASTPEPPKGLKVVKD